MEPTNQGGEGVLPPPTAPPTEREDDEHWHGFRDEPEPQAYVVPARARYGLWFAVLVFLVMLVALLLIVTHGGA